MYFRYLIKILLICSIVFIASCKNSNTKSTISVTSDIPNAMETVIASPIPIATFISVPTATPVPTSTPDTKIISIDPMNNPEQFISEIPIPEINCLTEIFNSKTEIINLITSPPGQYVIDNDLAKNSDECLSYDSKERIIIGLLDFSSGKLTDKTKSCIKDVGVGKSSFIYLFAKDPPPEIYLITLQSVFCLNKNERSIFEKSNYGQITSSMGGIDKIECFINELGPLGLINFDEPLKFIGGTYTINQLSPSVLEKFLSCGYFDNELKLIGITIDESLCILKNTNSEIIKNLFEKSSQGLSDNHIIELTLATKKCEINLEETTISIKNINTQKVPKKLINTESERNNGDKEKNNSKTGIEEILEINEINCLKEYITEEQIEEILTKLSPTPELFTAINKCKINIFEILSR